MSAFAQTVNLEQARDLAVANSRSLLRYEMSIRNSLLDEKNQLYRILPQVSAGYNATMDFVRDWEFVDPADSISAGAQVSITQIIFQGGRLLIQKAINSIETERLRKDAQAEYFNVLDSIDNAYYAILESRAALEAEESSLQAAEIGFSIAEIRAASGMINQGDFLKALADKEARENSRNQIRRNLTSSTNRFRTMTGISGVFELEQIDFERYENVIQHLAGISDDEVVLLFIEFWNILAASNPSLARAVLNTERAEKNLTLSRREYSPTIRATVFSTNLRFIPSYNTTAASGVTISGNIPLDFWVMNNRIKSSRISRDMAFLEYENTESSLEQDLQNSLFDLLTQAETVLSSRRSLEHTQRHFEFIMQRYRLLQSSVSDLSEATTLLINSRNNLNKASYSFLRSLSKLRSLCVLDDEEKLLELLLSNLLLSNSLLSNAEIIVPSP